MRHALPAHLTTVSNPRALLAIALDWALIIACFVAAIRFPHPLVFLASAILIARTQLALAVLMHESAHGTLLSQQRLNDIAGQLFAAAPLLLVMDFYRRGHLQHHRAPMAADDPVAITFGIDDYPVTREELRWRLFKDATGIGYFLSVRRLVRARERARTPLRTASQGKAFHAIASIVAVQGTMIGLLAAAGHAALYAGLWILPAVTLLPLFGRIRAITEHAGYRASEDQRLSARTVVRRSWQTFFVGPHAIHYHIEHHEYPRVPFYRLARVHTLMAQQGRLPAANLYRSYGQVLKDVSQLANTGSH
ncbi:fatty acid desaturase [Pseudoduganella lurida]|uniref:Fatty acid desaturase n=1 Tax=Pseudoduganella lurida TaxID=1036180 RepID=A0A562R2Z0_9BURK|nr:fatty acid desaturase family protein [Pseudoduganella lurida]TWI63427.1 fatty acid desaturase [Pseudoduganella lurida]